MRLLADSHKNTLTGASGDDFLKSVDSSDSYRYAEGDGADTIQEGGNKDKDVLKISGYALLETFVQKHPANPNSLLITFGGQKPGDSIAVVDTLGDSAADTVEQSKIDDGTT